MAIIFPSNLRIGSTVPVDDRYCVKTYADLASIVQKYESLRTYVLDEHCWYQYDGTQWVKDTTTIGENVVKVVANLDAANKETDLVIFTQDTHRHYYKGEDGEYHRVFLTLGDFVPTKTEEEDSESEETLIVVASTDGERVGKRKLTLKDFVSQGSENAGKCLVINKDGDIIIDKAHMNWESWNE